MFREILLADMPALMDRVGKPFSLEMNPTTVIINAHRQDKT